LNEYLALHDENAKRAIIKMAIMFFISLSFAVAKIDYI
jgi:hypothetical protein